MIDPEEVLANVPEQETLPTTEPAAAVDAVVCDEQPEAVAENEQAEAVADDEQPAEQENTIRTKDDVMERLRQLSQSGEAPSRGELEGLKQIYYRQQKAEAFEAFKEFVDGGGDANLYQQPADPTEAEFKALSAELRTRRAEETAELERVKAENLAAKLQIIEEIKQMAQDPEQAGRTYDDFKVLQTRWRETGPVPAEQATNLWKTYQLYVEHFYDALRQNIEMREYDFKKNLEAKTNLCIQAEALAENEDILAAFAQLQDLHQQWKETGPVARELREDIWNRFKTASTIINKRHQDHFLALKEQAEQNLAQKEALCQQVEAIEMPTTAKQWEETTAVITGLQAQWRTIGYATQKMNAKVYERFRLACDAFFRAKTEFFKAKRSEQAENLNQKNALIEKAEAILASIQEQTDINWRSLADKMVALQREWKAIGPVSRKISDQLWTRFNTACDSFFSARQQAEKSVRSEEADNLKKKRDVIARLQALADEGSDQLREAIRVLQDEWNSIGHVPYRDKEKIYKEYRALCDQLFDTLGQRAAGRRMEGFKRTMQQVAQQGGSALSRERDRLLRIRDNMRSEINTYENNLGFLSTSSKNGNSLIDQMRRKADKLREELALLQEKIKTVEQQMRDEA